MIMRLKILNLIMTVVIGFTCNAQSSLYSNERDRYFTEIYNAAEQGDAQAQLNLGVCYWNGNGVAKDYAEAVKWFRKAAEQGINEAIEALR